MRKKEKFRLGAKFVSIHGYHLLSDSLDVYDDAINNDDDIPSTHRRTKTLLDYIPKLEHKKASVREDALLAIIEILNHGDQYDTLEKYFATCLYQVLDCIKNGLDKEKQLASQALGLIAITLSETDNNAQELYKETISAVTKALTTKSLAIVTFFCSSNSIETEAAMQIIWKLIFPNLNLNVPTNQVSTIISSVIYAWLFLITKVNRWKINYNHWQGAICHLIALLEDETVCVAAGEALALIFECDNIDKFFSESDNNNKRAKSYSALKNQIKGMILNQIEQVSAKARGGLIALKQFLSNDKCPQIAETIYAQKLTLSSWSSIIQLKFLKDFLGEEQFPKLMLENNFLQTLFEFTPIDEDNEIPCLYESTMEKIETNLYLTDEEQNPETLTSKERKQKRNLRKLIIDKSKTKVLNKQRMWAEERKGRMYYIDSEY